MFMWTDKSFATDEEEVVRCLAAHAYVDLYSGCNAARVA